MNREALRAAVFRGYGRDAAALAERYDAISSDELYAPVRDLIPARTARVLDVGSGSGRDARWFAANGWSVVAVEPVDALRTAAATRSGRSDILWLNDALPDLSATQRLGLAFDVVTVSAVWQHRNRRSGVRRSRRLRAS